MSQFYRQLVLSERKLRKTLITKTVSNNPTTATSQYRLRSYRLLSHAEIEHYIENRILNKIAIDKNKWNSKGDISKCLSNLLAYHNATLPNVSSRLVEISSNNDISFRIGSTISSFQEKVKRNNGIKEVNIIPLLISIGIDYTKISQTLLNNLSSFGQNRGFTAHNSSKVQQLISPADEINIVDQIIKELYDVDELIDQIK
jgi:RiboL-PSP-HEPN